MVEFDEICFPGIFLAECVQLKRVSLGSAVKCWLGLSRFVANLEDGICPKEQLLQDYKKYVRDNFRFMLLVYGNEYRDLDKLERTLVYYK